MEGTRVGNYSITEKLAQGGMGAVYVARHELMGRDAVVKVLLPHLSQNKQMVSRFFNEARAATSIHHPGIVEVFDMGYTDAGLAYLVMEKLRGEPLSARLQRQRFRPTEAVACARQLAGALEAAHRRGIIHRDLKPDNLFVVPDPEVQGGERIKILDFGIAKLAVTQGGSLVTAAGAIFGTPAYMAPEQCKSTANVDHRADIYAIGCILYELLCGLPPFGQGGLELLAAHLRDEPIPPRARNPAVPPELDAIVLRLLAKAPEQRYQGCGELVSALDSLPSMASGVNAAAYAATLPPGASQSHSVQAEATNRPASSAPPLQSQGLPPQAPRPAPARAPSAGPAQQAPSAGPAQQLGTAPTAAPASVSDPPPAPSYPEPVTTHTAASGQQAAPTARHQQSRRSIILMVAAVGLMGGGIYTATQLGSGEDKAPEQQPIAAPAVPIPAPVRSLTPQRDAAPASPAQAALARARLALAKEDWGTALGETTLALATEPDSEPAKQLKTQAQDEIANQATFKKLSVAASKNRVVPMQRLWNELPETSVYRAHAEPLRKKVRDRWLAPHIVKATRYAKQGRCSRIAGVTKYVSKTFPEAVPQIETLAKNCKARSTAKATPGTRMARDCDKGSVWDASQGACVGSRSTVEKRPTTPGVKCPDEVACLLADNPPACCAKYGKRKTVSRIEKKPTGALPERLTRPLIRRGRNRLMRVISGCTKRLMQKPTGLVKITFVVAGSGRVTSVKTSDATAFGRCLVSGARRIRFPQTRAGGRFVLPVRVR